MKKLLLIFCSAFLIFNTNAQILDQSNTGSNSSGWLVNYGSYTSIGQSFTAGLTGFLSSIEIHLESGNSTYPLIAGNFTLTVRSGDGYAGAILGIDTFSITGLEPTGYYNIPIKPNTISVTASNVYTYIVREISGTGQIMVDASGPAYAGGSLYYTVFTNPPSTYSGDFKFKTYVQGCLNSSSTISPTVCNGTYTSPSGKIFTTSNTYMDTIPNTANCDSIITINLTINNIIDQTVTASQSSFCGSGSTTINTVSSDNGVDYYLRNDLNDTIVDGPIAGTGSNLAFNTGNINTTTTYNVYGTVTGPSTVGALEFTGNAGLKKVSLGTTMWNTEFAGNTLFTVEAWVKRSSLGSLHTIMSNYTTAYPFLFRIDSDKINLYLNSGTNATGLTTIPTGVWTHVAGTYDGTNIKVYVNGVLDGTSVPFSAALLSSTNELRIGGGISNNTEYFDGDIADVRLWNTARTQPQIAAEMNNVLSGAESGLVANYQFTEGTGTTTANASTGNLYPGTLISTPNWVNGPILNTVTCDLVMTNTPIVSINQSSTSTISPTACKTYTAPSGAVFTTSNTYMDTIPNAAMCDSVITINLTINTVDVSVTNASPFFTANATSATYQWVDCNNSFAAISGETNASFTATANGDYAVVVTQNGCTDTSACINVTGVGIDEARFNAVTVYPNPTNGLSTINMGNSNVPFSYIITSIDGKVIEQQTNVIQQKMNIDLTNNSKGVYLLKLSSDKDVKLIKLLKN